MALTDLEATIKKHMLLADPHIIKLLCGYIVAARLPPRAPWLFIVGPSSGGKSLLLESLEACRLVFPIDDLTPTTFASGMKSKEGGSNSLLDKLKNNSILIVKDFTTILSKDKEAQKNIIGQMRKIYDGDFVKKFGNGVEFGWKGKVSILAGVTSKVHTTMYQLADMGERFLMYNFEQPDREEQGMVATANLNTADKVKEMKEAFGAFVDSLEIPDKVPVIAEDVRRSFVQLAEFATRARSSVERNEFSREKEIRMVHFAEMPGRFATQLLVLAAGLMIVNSQPELMETDKQLLYKISLDSIPNIRRLCLQALTQYAEVETSSLAVKLKYPPATLRLSLQDLAALKVIDYTKSGNRDKWRLHENYRQLMSRYEKITMTNEVLEGLENSDMTETDLPSGPVQVQEEVIDVENET